MGRKRFDLALILWAVPALVSAASVPIPVVEHTPVLLAIPNADLLLHGQYRLSGRFQYFNTSQIGSVDTSMGDTAAGKASQIQNLNYSSELLVGIENRAEVGVQYGRSLSLSIKALLVREDLIWPDLVFGARNLFASQEGGLYGVSNETTLENLQAESFVTVAKSFASRSRVHLGLSVLTHVGKGPVSLNAAVEQDLGAGAWMGYEVFERFSDFHQVMTLQWRYRNLVGFSLAMTEFQSWIRQGGQWGFFLTPTNALKDGYNSPGISFSLQVLGWVPHREKRTLPERVAILEVKNAQLEKQLEDMNEVKRRLDELEARAAAPANVEPAPVAVPAPGQDDQTTTYLKSIAEKAGSDVADPREIRELMGKIVALGPEGVATIKRTAADTVAGPMRVHAVLVMGYSKDSTYIGSLRALCADADPRIRREALTALVKLGYGGVLEDAKRLLSDPDATVAMAAGEAYRQLKPDHAGAVVPKGSAPAATRKRSK